MIDWNRVRELRDEIGADDFGEVVLMFLQEADEVVLRIGAAGGPAQSPRGVAEDLHFLRGAAVNLGFRELAGLCHEAERRAIADQPVDLTVITDHFRKVRAIFVSDLQAELAG